MVSRGRSQGTPPTHTHTVGPARPFPSSPTETLGVAPSKSDFPLPLSSFSRPAGRQLCLKMLLETGNCWLHLLSLLQKDAESTESDAQPQGQKKLLSTNSVLDILAGFWPSGWAGSSAGPLAEGGLASRNWRGLLQVALRTWNSLPLRSRCPLTASLSMGQQKACLLS